MSRVFPGVADVFARAVRPVSMFIREDLPTLERPMKAYSGMFPSGHFFTSELLIIYSAVLIFINRIISMLQI